jgi:phosphatidylserine decarboxylase
MEKITYIDRASGKIETEKVFGGAFLHFLYGKSFFSRTLGRILTYLVSRNHIFSKLFGWWQKLPLTRRNIVPFIKDYAVDVSEFADDVDTFKSFNDFFIRKLKSESRPISSDSNVAVIPADGRYLFFENIDKVDGFLVKGKKFNLATFLQNAEHANEYRFATMVIARLCPSDYHRFHFPCDGIPGDAKLINGFLYSVNPIALKENINIFSENKRTITEIESDQFGKVLYIDVGATSVGSIIQTYKPNQFCAKGAEKGYFSFGGSSLVLLFQPGKIKLSDDLQALGKQGCEIKCLMGQPMGVFND